MLKICKVPMECFRHARARPCLPHASSWEKIAQVLGFHTQSGGLEAEVCVCVGGWPVRRQTVAGIHPEGAISQGEVRESDMRESGLCRARHLVLPGDTGGNHLLHRKTLMVS